MMRRLRRKLEAGLVWLLFHALRGLPVEAASNVGGWLGRTLGPHLPVSRRARRNMRMIFPEWSEAERERHLRAMWDNLGRVAGEYPHIGAFGYGPGQRVEVEGLEHLLSLRDDGRPGLFFSAHYGNWELAGLSAARNGLPISLIYRAANNPDVDWIFAKGRSVAGIEVIPKGRQGARQALFKLKEGGHLGMLVDQKMNDGIAVPFLGQAAMTAPALAVFALKYRCPVVPARVMRLKGARFRISFEPPLRFEDSGDHHADVRAAMTTVNSIIERWIREAPEQWLWLHNRWPD